MLDTELRDVSLAVDDLWIVIISLSLNLGRLHFLEDVVVVGSLVHAHHVGVNGRALVLLGTLIRFKLVLRSGRHHSFLGVCAANIVLLVAFI